MSWVKNLEKLINGGVFIRQLSVYQLSKFPYTPMQITNNNYKMSIVHR